MSGVEPEGLTRVLAKRKFSKVLLRRKASARARAPSSPNSTSKRSTKVRPILTLSALAKYYTPLSPSLFIPKFNTLRYGLVESD